MSCELKTIESIDNNGDLEKNQGIGILKKRTRKKTIVKDVFDVILYFIILIVFPIVSITIIIVNQFHASTSSIIANVFLILKYLTVIISLGYILTKTKKLNLRGRRKNNQISNEEESHEHCNSRYFEIMKANLYIYTLIFILGTGDSVFTLLVAADEIIELINKDFEGNFEFTYKIFVIIEEIAAAVYHLNILLFIVYHKSYTKIIINSFKIKFFIILLSFSSLMQWIFIISREIHHDDELLNEVSIDSYNTTNNRSDYLQQLDKHKAFLFPFGIEFRITCFIELLLIALLMSHEHGFHHLNRNINFIQSTLERFEALFIKAVNKIYSVTSFFMDKITVKHRNKMKTYRNMIVEEVLSFNVTTLTLVLICAGIVIVLFEDLNAQTNQIMVYEINEVCKLIIIALTLFYTTFLLICVLRRSKIKNEDDLYEHANSLHLEKKLDMLLLHLSYVELLAFGILTAIGSIITFWFSEKEEHNNLIPEYIKYIAVVTSLLPCIQSTLQLIVIWLCANKINLNKNYLKTLIVFNFTLWIFETFSSTKTQKNHIQQIAYGDNNWKILSAVFLPMSIFYRFHSCLMLVKIKADKYLVDEDD